MKKGKKGLTVGGILLLLGMSACGTVSRTAAQESVPGVMLPAEQTEHTESTYAETTAETESLTEQPGPQRMLMVNGTLYVDTGYVSGIWGRCGNLDGNIDNVISDMEIPTEDGQANFMAAGWQMGVEEDTIEVPLDGEFCIFAAQGSKKEGYIPASVAQFLATVEEVTEDGYVIVRTDRGVSQMFSGKIKENERYKLSLEHYECDINIPVESLSPGNGLCVICKNNLEGTDPAVITDVYSVSPLHGNVCQTGQYPPADEVTGTD